MIWPRVTALHGTMGPGSVDFLQGFLVGIGIACEFMGIIGLMAGGKGKRGSPPVLPD